MTILNQLSRFIRAAGVGDHSSSVPNQSRLDHHPLQLFRFAVLARTAPNGPRRVLARTALSWDERHLSGHPACRASPCLGENGTSWTERHCLLGQSSARLGQSGTYRACPHEDALPLEQNGTYRACLLIGPSRLTGLAAPWSLLALKLPFPRARLVFSSSEAHHEGSNPLNLCGKRFKPV